MEANANRSPKLKDGKPRMDNMHFKALVANRPEDPVMEVNGVKYTAAQYSFVLERLQEMDKKGYASDSYCSLCGGKPCISHAAGGQPLLDFAKALRGRSLAFNDIRDQCARYLLTSRGFLELYQASGKKEIPECVIYWVDNRCCMGANW